MRATFFLAFLLSAILPNVLFAQSELTETRDFILERLQAFDEHSEVVVIDSNRFVWFKVNTFTVTGYNSAIRGSRKRDTLSISFSLQDHWDSVRIVQTQEMNALLIEELKVIYTAYMDSINWRGYKITKDEFESNVVQHLKWQYPVKFSLDERDKINQIQRYPDFLLGTIGIFVDGEFPGIKEENVNIDYARKFEFISREIFGLEEVNYGSPLY